MENKNRIRIAFGIVILSLFVALLIGGGLVALLTSINPDYELEELTLLSMTISTLLIAVPVIIYLKNNKLSLKENLRFNGISKQTLLAITLLSIGLIILIDEIDRIVYILFGQPDFLEELVEQLTITNYVNGFLIIFSTAIAAPLVEELLFRGYLQKVLEESWQDITKAILVTSLLFALIHLNPYWVVQIYLLGMVLGYLSWRTNSILPGIILHGLNNGFAVALNNAQPFFNKYYNWHEHVYPIWIVAAIILVYFGFKILNKDLETSQ